MKSWLAYSPIHTSKKLELELERMRSNISLKPIWLCTWTTWREKVQQVHLTKCRNVHDICQRRVYDMWFWDNTLFIHISL